MKEVIEMMKLKVSDLEKINREFAMQEMEFTVLVRKTDNFDKYNQKINMAKEGKLTTKNIIECNGRLSDTTFNRIVYLMRALQINF